METTNSQIDNSGKKKKLILIGIGVVVTGVAGYFGYDYWQKRKAAQDDAGDSADALPPPPDKKAFHSTLTKGSGSGLNPQSDEFPLKKGSKGSKVKMLQRALIAKFGKSLLPKYGADGDFGNEMVSGLKRAGLPSEVDQSTYDSLVSGAGVSSGSSIDAAAIGKILADAAVAGDVSRMLPSLQKMSSTDDYTAVNREFENYNIQGVRKTLVNGLLSALSDENQKQQVRLEFSRMGLKYNGNKWSLSGIVGAVPIMTTEATYVWAGPKEAIKVPSQMVLGTEIEERGGYTLFENNGHHFLVKTKSIKSL
jgi:hypothetical protein